MLKHVECNASPLTLIYFGNQLIVILFEVVQLFIELIHISVIKNFKKGELLFGIKNESLMTS